jgi:hypothetical protein
VFLHVRGEARLSTFSSLDKKVSGIYNRGHCLGAQIPLFSLHVDSMIGQDRALVTWTGNRTAADDSRLSLARPCCRVLT